jgi:hypothetical protein
LCHCAQAPTQQRLKCASLALKLLKCSGIAAGGCLWALTVLQPSMWHTTLCAYTQPASPFAFAYACLACSPLPRL